MLNIRVMQDYLSIGFRGYIWGVMHGVYRGYIYVLCKADIVIFQDCTGVDIDISVKCMVYREDIHLLRGL